MIITVIGLGLIGGSFAKSLRQISSDYHLIGSDASAINEEKALSLQLVDECLPQQEAIDRADVILLAIPVNYIPKLLNTILDHIRPDQLVIDFGSTKDLIAQSVNNHPNRKNYLSAHPMAGTENTGPEAAMEGLFTQKKLILCDIGNTDPLLLKEAKLLFEKLSFNIIEMDSKSHDHHIAYVSHLSHVSSFMLSLTVLEKETDEDKIFNMAGSGFSSTVRLAMSSPQMWTPIFTQNKENVKTALTSYISYLRKFEQALDSGDEGEIHQMMEKANLIRKALDNPK